jgi:hypothetical protein
MNQLPFVQAAEWGCETDGEPKELLHLHRRGKKSIESFDATVFEHERRPPTFPGHPHLLGGLSSLAGCGHARRKPTAAGAGASGPLGAVRPRKPACGLRSATAAPSAAAGSLARVPRQMAPARAALDRGFLPVGVAPHRGDATNTCRRLEAVEARKHVSMTSFASSGHVEA